MLSHDPATDDEIENYRAGILDGVMVTATVNVVASLIARLDQLTERVRALETEVAVLRPSAEHYHAQRIGREQAEAREGKLRAAVATLAHAIGPHTRGCSTCRAAMRRDAEVIAACLKGEPTPLRVLEPAP